jgi:uncharacterized coiled-coil protein SlyX
MICLEPRAVAGYFPGMRTAAFILFAVVTAAAAALSTLVATRYLSLEKDAADVRSQLEDVRRELKRQETEKVSMLLDRQRIQADLEGRFAEQRTQLEECGNQRQQEFQEILNTLANLQKRISDTQAQAAPSAATEQGAPPAPSGQTNPAAPKEQATPSSPGEKAEPKGGETVPPGVSQAPQETTAQPPAKAKATDVRRGAVPTPEQEAKTLDKAQ